jgi:putative effector of murein hydrolase LrgA (UPF0299 family)
VAFRFGTFIVPDWRFCKSLGNPKIAFISGAGGMNGLRGMAWLLVFQSIGELVSRGLSLPLPGPVLGMMLMLAGLRFPAVREPVAECANFLLAHLSLLFVPVGVGVMTNLDLLSHYGGRMLAVIAVSTWLGLGVTALVLYWPDREKKKV